MKRPRPDTRPSWRDPSLPCIRDYRFANGERMVEVEPDYERRYREHMMPSAEQPSYRNDPTYDLRRKA
jgi:hypothetical protein